MGRAIINKIGSETSTNIHDKKNECLQSYFDSDEGSWEEMVIAVARHPINKKRIAKDIAEQHLHSPNKDAIISMVNNCKTFD